jgi:DnaJ domain
MGGGKKEVKKQFVELFLVSKEIFDKTCCKVHKVQDIIEKPKLKPKKKKAGNKSRSIYEDKLYPYPYYHHGHSTNSFCSGVAPHNPPPRPPGFGRRPSPPPRLRVSSRGTPRTESRTYSNLNNTSNFLNTTSNLNTTHDTIMNGSIDNHSKAEAEPEVVVEDYHEDDVTSQDSRMSYDDDHIPQNETNDTNSAMDVDVTPDPSSHFVDNDDSWIYEVPSPHNAYRSKITTKNIGVQVDAPKKIIIPMVNKGSQTHVNNKTVSTQTKQKMYTNNQSQTIPVISKNTSTQTTPEQKNMSTQVTPPSTALSSPRADPPVVSLHPVSDEMDTQVIQSNIPDAVAAFFKAEADKLREEKNQQKIAQSLKRKENYQKRKNEEQKRKNEEQKRKLDEEKRKVEEQKRKVEEEKIKAEEKRKKENQKKNAMDADDPVPGPAMDTDDPVPGPSNQKRKVNDEPVPGPSNINNKKVTGVNKGAKKQKVEEKKPSNPIIDRILSCSKIEFYKILNLRDDSLPTLTALRKAYRDTVRQIHPDKNAGIPGSNEAFLRAQAAFAGINREIIWDKERKKTANDNKKKQTGRGAIVSPGCIKRKKQKWITL